MNSFKRLALFPLLWGACSLTAAAPGDLDSNFSGGKVFINQSTLTSGAMGNADKVEATAIIQDRQTLVPNAIGNFKVVGNVATGIAMASLLPTGAADGSFGASGMRYFGQIGQSNSTAAGILRQSSGKYMIAGGGVGPGTNGKDILLLRVNANGTTDTSYNGVGYKLFDIAKTTDDAKAIIQQADGKLVVVGSTIQNSKRAFLVMRFSAYGELDKSFNGTGYVVKAMGNSLYDSYATSVIQQRDGKLVVGGVARNGNVDSFALARFNADGTLDNTFDNNRAALDGQVLLSAAATEQNSALLGLGLQADGKILATGSVADGSGTSVAVVRLNAIGTPDSTFAAAGKFNLSLSGMGSALEYGVSVYEEFGGVNGLRRIVVGGTSHSNLTGYNLFVARLTTGGVLDNTFAGKGYDQFNSAQDYGDRGASVIQANDGGVVIAGTRRASSLTGNQFFILKLTDADVGESGVGKASDGYADSVDQAPQDPISHIDTDGDGVGDGSDNCVSVFNTDQTDTDSDGIGNACEKPGRENIPDLPYTDTDADMVPNPIDNCPSKPNTDQQDSDGDGFGDVCDNSPYVPSPNQSDADGDLIGDVADNCPAVINYDQADLDFDGQGDACDADIDGDGVPNGSDAFPTDPSESADTDSDGIGDNADNCPAVSNPTQLDADGDTIGDPCDPNPTVPDAAGDGDGDGIGDSNDNCPLMSNANQSDADGDGVGDVCDNAPGIPNSDQLDTDGDTVGDVLDNCDAISNSNQFDADGDGVGDVCDNAPSVPNSDQTDGDGDGVADVIDNCPAVNNIDQLNTDGDSQGDACDTDDDNDGVPDISDPFPTNPGEAVDTDGDGIGNGTDTDDDGDGVPDVSDAFPLNPGESVDTDGDGIGNNADDDDDGDGVTDTSDAFPLDPAESFDTDGDGIGNNADTDDDGDGVADASDAFPLDPTESVDTDGDGIGNNADSDDDGDGVTDAADAFPLDPSESVDTDNDGIGNNADSDDDADGVPDASDAFPLDPTESVDTDGDGIGNNADSDDDGDGVSDTVEATNGTNPLLSDTDGDGSLDGADNCPVTANADQANLDGDAFGDVCDTDIDGDGYANGSDAFPTNPAEWLDTDGDGEGNNADNCPSTANAGQENLDGDADGDACDADIDGDGYANGSDAFPTNPAEWLDTDADGVGDNADNCPVLANPDQADLDLDMIGDACDADPSDPNVLGSVTGITAKKKLGASVAFIGDVDGDGRDDVLVGSPSENRVAKDVNGLITSVIKSTGSATVYSVARNQVLYTLYGDRTGDRFGFAVAGGQDLNGDGVVDFVVGAPGADVMVGNKIIGKDVGKVVVYSGATGAKLYEKYGNDDQVRGQFGYSVAIGGDIDNLVDQTSGAKHPDIVIGAPFASVPVIIDGKSAKISKSGMVFVISGRSGAAISARGGVLKNDGFGNSVAALGDIDMDGAADYAVGASKADVTVVDSNGKAIVMKDAGTVTVFNAYPTPMKVISGDVAGGWLGYSIANAGDVNADGRNDLVIGSPNAPSYMGAKKLKKAGRVMVVASSGLATKLVDRRGAAANEMLGYSVSGAGKVNGDVYGDVVASAKMQPGGTKGAGALYVFSGNPADTSQPPILSATGLVKGDWLGYAVGGGGDANGDGFFDILYGITGSDAGAKDGGMAQVLSGAGAVTY